MKFILLLALSTTAFAFSPESITYKTAFDQERTLNINLKMKTTDFEFVSERFAKLGSWTCIVTAAPKKTLRKKLRINKSNYALQSVTIVSDYGSKCNKLPNFSEITVKNTNDKNPNTISLHFKSENNEDLSIKLYGHNRAVIYDKTYGGEYKGMITKAYK